MMHWLVLLSLVGCTAPPPLTPAALVLRGRVIAKPLPGPNGDVPLILVDAAGAPYRLLVRGLTRSMANAGTPLVSGDRLTAWCHVEGADTVADSVRVEPRP